MSNFFSRIKRPGVNSAGIFSLALMSVVLLCGAGYVPLENFTPVGPMQADLNAGGHSLTNAATVSAANVVVSGTLTAGAITGTATAANFASSAATAGSATTATSAANLTGTITPAHIAPTVGSGTAVVVASAGPNMPGGVATVGTGGVVTLGAAPANSIVVVLGDSIAAGYPVVTLNSSSPQTQTGYAGPGKCWPQWLSATAFFHNIAIYDFGVGSAKSSDGAALLGGTGTIVGTEYRNGAVVGSYGGITTAPSSLAATALSAGGTVYCVNAYGTNDVSSGGSLSAFESNMQSIDSTEHAWGSGVVVIGVTLTDRADNLDSWTNASLQPFSSWIRAQIGVASTGYDLVADVGVTLNNATDANFFYQGGAPVGLHLLSSGYYYYAQDIVNSILGFPAVGSLSVARSTWLTATTSDGSNGVVGYLGGTLRYGPISGGPNTGTTYVEGPFGASEQYFGLYDPVNSKMAYFYDESQQKVFVGPFSLGTSTGIGAPVNLLNGLCIYSTSGVPNLVLCDSTNSAGIKTVYTAMDSSGDWEFDATNDTVTGVNATWMKFWRSSYVADFPNGLETEKAFAPDMTTTVTTGSSGTVTWAEPFQGTAYKIVVARMSGNFAGTATLVLPTAFTATPVVVNSDAAATTVGTGTIVLTGTGTLPRTAVLEGF